MGLHDSKYRDGKELMDGTPIAVPIGFKRPPSLIEQMRSMIRREVSEAAAARGRETFEESNDFDVGDDPEDPSTPWEDSADGDDQVASGLEEARMARAARAAGFVAPDAPDPVALWADRNGWVKPSKPSDQAPEAPQAPSAGADSKGKPSGGARGIDAQS